MNDSDSDSSGSNYLEKNFIHKDDSIENSVKSLKSNPMNLKSKDENSDDDTFINVPEDNEIELFSEIIKNLQTTQRAYINNKDFKQHFTKNDNLNNIKETNIEEKTNIINEINAVLLQGENRAFVLDENDEDSSENENVKPPAKYTIPKEGVKITLSDSSMLCKKKTNGRKESGLAAILRRKLRTNQIFVNKVSRLCWLGYGFYLNRQANDLETMAAIVSLILTKDYPKEKLDLKYLTKITKWFRNIFTLESDDTNDVIDRTTLLKRIGEKNIFNYKELVVLYVAILRGIGLNCRLIVSLNPLPTKSDEIYNNLIPKTSATEKNNKIKENTEIKEYSSSKEDHANNIIQYDNNTQKSAKLIMKKRAAKIFYSKCFDDKKDKTTKQQNDVQISSENEQSEASCSNRKSQNIDSNSKKEKREKLSSKMKKKCSDNNETKAIIKFKEKEETKDLAFTTEEDYNKIKNRRDIWAEVYVDSEKHWVSIDVIDGNVDCVVKVYEKASKPVVYVIAYNSEGLIKDVTRRYCPHWLSVTRKQRVDEKWWTETLSYWLERESVISKREDELLLQKELEQPLPKTISACKGHPLYVLVRHLLKYEALYPPECVPLGYLNNGEAIYSRYCVYTLCSREKWLKKARVVKPNQEPYKIVKALQKYDKLSGIKLKDTALELFGEWQTIEYIPPEAKNGIVPRNEYGNVDLFKKCMLPKGTVHINLPGLNRLARKLNIDCVSAVVGFNFGCNGAVPATEGFVVCAEYEDILREAWEAEQIEAAKRIIQKKEKRIYDNWRKLIKGLLIREKLIQKYEFLDKHKRNQLNKRSKHRKGTLKKSKT